MKTLLTLVVVSFLSTTFPAELQDSTRNQNREKEQLQIQEKNQQQNQGDENQIRDRNKLQTGDPLQNKDGKKRGKDVFIDKDGDGIADTRAGGMSLNKIRKRTRSGSQGGSGHGNDGHNGSGGQGGK